MTMMGTKLHLDETKRNIPETYPPMTIQLCLLRCPYRLEGLRGAGQLEVIELQGERHFQICSIGNSSFQPIE